MKKEDPTGREDFPYRKTVAAVVVDDNGRFLLGQKSWYPPGQYEFLGGGIESGETLGTAALRELEEEAGLKGFQVVAQSEITHEYEWPDEISTRYCTDRGQMFRGQKQGYVLVKFRGNPDDIKPDSDELKHTVWVTREELPDYLTFPNQWETVRRVLWELSSTGTEIYGLKPEVVETEIETSDPNLELRVLDPAGMLRLQVIDHSEHPPDSFSEYPLPRVYSSLEELQKRPPLRVFRESESSLTSSKTKDVLAELLEGFDWYIAATRPGFSISTITKLYEKYLPGVEARTRLLNAPASNRYGSISDKIKYMQELTGTQWTGGFSGDIRIEPNVFTEATIVSLNRQLENDPLTKPLTIPLFDFDTQFSRNPRNELERVINALKSNGFSGWIAKSGGGHHFIGDFLVPRDPGLWRSLGLMAKLTLSQDEKFERHRNYAESMYQSPTLENARTIANEILDPERGILNIEDAYIGDIRWCAHSTLRGFTVLRSEPFWKNPNFPKVIARIY